MTTTTPDIFLSYNREDATVAARYADAFAAEGLSVWWDTALRSGEAYDEVTEAALRGAKAVVVLWSPRSVVSRWVRAEATIADRCKTLVPVTIEPCERPIMFELTQTAELSHWDGDPHDEAWLSFLVDVNRYVRREAVAAPASQPAPPPAPAKPGAKIGERGDVPSLAVMPFSNRSGLPGDDALAFGMVEDIIEAISHSPYLRVLASSATAKWAGKPADLRDVGRDLGARYVMEGNVRRTGANLRVTVQLVEAESVAILWTRKFERPLSELADLQEELVTEVAAHLGVQVLELEMARALKKPGDISAYESVQRAVAIHARQKIEDYPAAIAEARRAIAISPDYAYAWGRLAFLLSRLAHSPDDSGEANKREALESARRAAELGSNEASVMAQVGIAIAGLGQFDEGYRYARRSYDLNPHNTFCMGAMAVVSVLTGRNDAAVDFVDQCERFAPGGFVLPIMIAYKAGAHAQAGRLDDACDTVERAFDLKPDQRIVLIARTAICALAGRAEQAADSIRQIRRVSPDATLDLLLGNFALFVSPHGAPLRDAFCKAWDATPMEGA